MPLIALEHRPVTGRKPRLTGSVKFGIGDFASVFLNFLIVAFGYGASRKCSRDRTTQSRGSHCRSARWKSTPLLALPPLHEPALMENSSAFSQPA